MNLQSLKQEYQAINTELRELNGKLQEYAQKSEKDVLSVVSDPDFRALDPQRTALRARHEKNISDLRIALETMEPTAASEFLKSFA